MFFGGLHYGYLLDYLSKTRRFKMIRLLNCWEDYDINYWSFHFFDIHWENEEDYPILTILICNFGIQIHFTNQVEE